MIFSVASHVAGRFVDAAAFQRIYRCPKLPHFRYKGKGRPRKVIRFSGKVLFFERARRQGLVLLKIEFRHRFFRPFSRLTGTRTACSDRMLKCTCAECTFIQIEPVHFA
ncbi:hypothetical protein KR98_22750 [Ralstonia solanacearum]|nr:hypothetical protein KR98_22750 [Ralstonia solanacearum]OCQ70895.1 hypothetical protein AR465_19365 [Ralstonia solanacearum]